MKTNLFAFGCSHTYGYGLPDVVQYMNSKEIYPTKFGENYNFGSKLAWPQLLADKLNLTCYNYGCCGANSKEVVWIFTQCLQHNMISNRDTVTILWPAFARTGIFHYDGCVPSDRQWLDKLDKKDTVFYTDYYDEYDFAIQRWREIILVDLICKERGINCYHGLVNKELTPKEVGLESLTKNMNIDFTPMDAPGNSSSWIIDKALDGDHHGVGSHKLIADKWNTFIKGRKI